jgi:hypothetical protein
MSEEIKAGPKGPSKYTAEYIEDITTKLEAYIDSVNLPLWSEFCGKNRCPRRLARDFCAQSERFSDTYERLMALQEAALQRLGIAGKGNATVIALILKTHHDYKDKSEIGSTPEITEFLRGVIRKASMPPGGTNG